VVGRPHELRSVQRQTVRLHNRTYFHESLALFDAKDVDVEYDLHNDSKVWVFDTKGRFICEAKLTNTIGVLPTSRIEEQRQKRLEGQKKRLHRHLEEAEARAQDAITAADVVAGLEHMAPSTLQLPSAPAADVIEIDLLNWRDKT
jgi:putative transposase